MLYILFNRDETIGGYIIDRMGFAAFASEVLEQIELSPAEEVVELNNPGYFYPKRKQLA